MEYCGFVIRRERLARCWSQQDALYARLNLPVLDESQCRDAEPRIQAGMGFSISFIRNVENRT